MKSKKYNWTLLSLEFLIIPKLFPRTRGAGARDSLRNCEVTPGARGETWRTLNFAPRIYRLVKRREIISIITEPGGALKARRTISLYARFVSRPASRERERESFRLLRGRQEISRCVAHWRSIARDFPARICRRSLWRWSGARFLSRRVVSKSLGEFARRCRTEGEESSAFTVLLRAKLRSGRCPESSKTRSH